MRARTKKRLVLALGLLLTPVIGVLLVAGAATYDGGVFGSTLVVGVPLALYGIGVHLVMKELAIRNAEENPARRSLPARYSAGSPASSDGCGALSR